MAWQITVRKSIFESENFKTNETMERTLEEYKQLFYEENVLAWLGMAETDRELEYAVHRIVTDNFAPTIWEDALDLYEEHFGKSYDMYGEEEAEYTNDSEAEQTNESITM